MLVQAGEDLEEEQPIASNTRTSDAPHREATPTGEILIVGGHERLGPIVATLEAADRRLHRIDDLGAAAARLAQPGEEPATVVLVAPLRDGTPGEAIQRLASAPEGGEPPRIYVVCPAPLADPEARSLYLAGAGGVFEWPRDSLLVTQLLRDRLEPTGADRPEASMAGAVRARMGQLATRRPPRGLRVRVRGGLARLSGRVDSLWARLKLAERARRTPGIERVAAQEVRIEPSGRTDAEIAESVRAVLRGAAGVEDHTLAVAVHDGHVSVVGWADSPEEQARVSELIGLTEGARGVIDRTELDADAKRRDAARARDLEARIRERCPAGAVRAAVVGDTAVLHGRVPRLSLKLAIERLVRAAGVERLVNRIEVEPRGS